jgi:hypothetical protein
MAERAKKKSPLRRRPLNTPGESQRGRLWDIITEEFGAWVTVCVVISALAAWEWMWLLIGLRPQPAVVTLYAVGVIAVFLVWKLPGSKRRLRQTKLGIEGEKHVAEVLDELKADGYHVIHDIVEDGYNIDHVLIGPTGVYVIETKTRSKSDDRRDVHVLYDGQRVLVDGHEPDRDPLRQVQALADRVGEVLRSQAALDPPIRPVVLFPGWYVERQPKGVRIWVLNPNNLPQFVRHEPVRLSKSVVATLVAALRAHARFRSEQPA